MGLHHRNWRSYSLRVDLSLPARPSPVRLPAGDGGTRQGQCPRRGKRMRVRFGTVEEFLEELGLAVDAPLAAMTPPILRLTCTYTPVQGQALRATVVAGVLVHRQLIELQQYCGNVWDRPEAPDVPKASMTPADEKIHTKVTAVLSAVMQFATAHAWVVR